MKTKIMNGKIKLWMVTAIPLAENLEDKNFYFVVQNEAKAWIEKLRNNGCWCEVKKERKVSCPVGRAWVGYHVKTAAGDWTDSRTGKGGVFLFPNAWCREQIYRCADSAIKSLAQDNKYISWELVHMDYVGGGDIEVEDYEKNGWRVSV